MIDLGSWTGPARRVVARHPRYRTNVQASSATRITANSSGTAKASGRANQGERDEDPEGRLLVVEDGEDAEQPDLHGGEEVHAVVEQPLLVQGVLPEAVELIRVGRVGRSIHDGGPGVR